MATETVIELSELPDLREVTHTQSNELWDVIALIEGAREVPFVHQGESGDRLLQMAKEKLLKVQQAFDPYI